MRNARLDEGQAGIKIARRNINNLRYADDTTIMEESHFFLPRSKHLLISWLQSLSAVMLEPKNIKSVTVSMVSSFAIKWWDQMPWSYFFECWVLSQLLPSPLSLSSRGSLVLLCFLPQGWCLYISEVIDIFPGNLDSSLSFIQPGISHDVLCI